jgi:2,5-diketo-D-gluconate reductase A
MNSLFDNNVTLNDGNIIPPIGFGVFLISDEEVYPSVASAIDIGYRLIDTASIYKNENGVGRAVKECVIPRSSIYITTKVWNDAHGNGKTRESCKASLQRLNLDYIDLLLIHWPCPTQNLFVEAWRELIDLKDEGFVRSIGVSNFNITHLEELIQRTNVVPSVNQVECHPWLQQDELRLFHHEVGIKTQAWSPLGRGKLLKDPILTSIASKHSITTAQVILSWHYSKGILPIPKSTNSNRMQENIDAIKYKLDDDDLSQITLLQTGTRVGPDPLSFG